MLLMRVFHKFGCVVNSAVGPKQKRKMQNHCLTNAHYVSYLLKKKKTKLTNLVFSFIEISCFLILSFGNCLCIC